MEPKQKQPGLYEPRFEHDNYGIDTVANTKDIRSHRTVGQALHIIENLGHRTGKDAKGKTGDGVRITLQISHEFFKEVTELLGFQIGGRREYGVGMFLSPQDELVRNQATRMFGTIVRKEGMTLLGWKVVLIAPGILGKKTLGVMPYIAQGLVGKPAGMEAGLDFDRKLYVARRVFEQSNEDTYVVSLSSRIIVYRGMLLVGELRLFFSDLQGEDYKSAITIVHSRFSTNTNPSWMRAHLYRFIVHSDEINTIRGNVDKMMAREEGMESEYFRYGMHKVLPIINQESSNSAMLDNILELMVMSDMDLPLAVIVTIPAPWENDRYIDSKIKDLYRYYATVMEPWDDPASILSMGGDVVGVVLDRNGLHLSRYYITEGGCMILTSEVDTIDINQARVVKEDRLRPGKMLLVDTRQRRLAGDDELKHYYASRNSYEEWLDSNLCSIKDLPVPNECILTIKDEGRLRLQKTYGYTYEQYKTVILPMALNGAEVVPVMGVDTPLTVLSKKHRPLFNYFRQLFAQVTNPPIDTIREKIVTSTTVYVGEEDNILEETAESYKILKVEDPILTETDLLKIKNIKKPGFKMEAILITYYKSTSLEKIIDRLFLEVDRAHKDDANIIVLPDRNIDENHVPIPPLLAVSALQQYLVRTKERTGVALVLESGEPRGVHHFATPLGYGAYAVNPYLAHESIRSLVTSGILGEDYYTAIYDYSLAVLHDIVKTTSKMGIFTIRSYQDAQIPKVIGISKDVVDKYPTNAVSRADDITLKGIAGDVDTLRSTAFDLLGLGMDLTLKSVGGHKSRSGEEAHLYSPLTIHLLQEAVRTDNYGIFKQYTVQVDREDKVYHLRSPMDFDFPEGGDISLDQIEPVESIVRRFKAEAMSYGSISQEVHECLAIAMNRVHGESNTREGGESLDHLIPGSAGNNHYSAIKQVASGRSGITSCYLVSAREIQVKMARGTKSGEGDQPPGGKVYPWVAKTRHSTTGTNPISPPPHHDIYSIEDLTQLVHDLKNSNTGARISIKLVSEVGVGTVAAGMAKAGTQVILISAYDGGTGAAPRNSIYNAGLPWELGVAETHQTLVMNRFRDKVILGTDGELMTRRDMAMACMLGAEEFGFTIAPLITLGCVMVYICNLDTCPMGIAAQNPELRKRFRGKPEYVVNSMRFITQELREYMTKPGVRAVDELVGRTDLSKRRDSPPLDRTSRMDLSRILGNPYGGRDVVGYSGKQVFDFRLEDTMDEQVLLRRFKSILGSGQERSLQAEVFNVDRTPGTIFGSEITRKYPEGLSGDTFTVSCNGNKGQSFGAFIPGGLTLELAGDSNDYFSRGLSDGKLVVYPPKGVFFKAKKSIIVGNMALCGATSGKAFINEITGERFCVRGSRATAVVEGVGDHGCEYMTGGCVVVLGTTGKNFGAGMNGGIVYVLGGNRSFYKHLNKELVSFEGVTNKHDVPELKGLIEEHVACTNSPKGRRILGHLSEYLPRFKKVVPHDYRRTMNTIVQMEEKGLNSEQTQIEAFHANLRG